MNREYNYQAFTPDEVEQGLHLDLVNYLLDHNKKNENQYYDIHITTDGYCIIIEWTDVSYDKHLGPEGKFEYVPGNGYVMIEKHFPDGHYDYFGSEEEFEEVLKDWLKENPGWVKTPYGTWTNEIENEKFKKELEKQEKENKKSEEGLKKSCV